MAEVTAAKVEDLQLWRVPARLFAAANSKVATEQIAAYVRDNDLADPAAVSESGRY
jgi:hypothetical protein